MNRAIQSKLGLLVGERLLIEFEIFRVDDFSLLSLNETRSKLEVIFQGIDELNVDISSRDVSFNFLNAW